MGIRQHFAELLAPSEPIHPRMGLVCKGYGQLFIAVRAGWWRKVPLETEGLSLLAGNWSGESYLVARPRAGRWPQGAISVRPRAYQDDFTPVRVEVGPDGPLPTAPTFEFKQLVLKPPPVLPSHLQAPPPPFYVPGPSAPITSLGLIGGSGSMIKLDVFLSTAQMLAGWVPNGAVACVAYSPPGEVAVMGAVASDLLGQHTVYGEIPPRILARYVGPG